MKAIILFQVGNITIALDILNQIAEVYNNFDDITIFFSILDTLNTKPLIEYLNYIKHFYTSINYIIISHHNKGMDIGPFLNQMKYLVEHKLHYDLLLKIHTKSNVIWKNELINPLINNIKLIKEILTSKNNIGLIGADRWTLNQDRLNQQVIINLLNKLNIKNNYFKNIEPTYLINDNLNEQKIEYNINTKFVGGTIFWARYDLFYNFFLKVPLYQLLYHLLEEKYTINNKATIVHAMERFLCLIVYIMDYEVYGIS